MIIVVPDWITSIVRHIVELDKTGQIPMEIVYLSIYTIQRIKPFKTSLSWLYHRTRLNPSNFNGNDWIDYLYQLSKEIESRGV